MNIFLKAIKYIVQPIRLHDYEASCRDVQKCFLLTTIIMSFLIGRFTLVVNINHSPSLELTSV